MKIWKIVLLSILGLALIVGLAFGTGALGVVYTKTIGVEQQDANREVFENTNSFTKAKRQEILKYYKEWQAAETDEDKKAIEVVVRMSLADFDEDKYITNPDLLSWVRKMKY